MKKGISLIVLVITIIVIIILAGAVILSLVQNNPIGQANQAVRTNDAAEIESALAMYLGTIMGQYKDTVKLSVPGSDPVALNGVAIVNYSGAQLYRNATTNDVKTTADTDYTALTVTPAALGFGTQFPSYPGYYLVVDQYANVDYSTTNPAAPVIP